MRIKIKMRVTKISSIPINYQYFLAAAIYKILRSASPKYSEWLHKYGYESKNKKVYKMFVFSKIFSDKPMIYFKETLTISPGHNCFMYISSPLFLDFITNLIEGMFMEKKIIIGSKEQQTIFEIEQVESMPIFMWHKMLSSYKSIRFLSRSPIIVSRSKGKNSSYYFRPEDPGLGDAIRKNLLQKYNILYGKFPKDKSFEFAIDQKYVANKGGYNQISKLISIKEGTHQESHLKSFECPIYLSGNPELIACAYECGIGEKNSMGFGMIEPREKR